MNQPQLTPRQREILNEMRAAEEAENFEDAEIVGAKGEFWLGLNRISPRTVHELLKSMLISKEDFSDTGAAHYTINESGRNVLKDESQLAVLQRSVLEGGAWTWREGKLVRMT